MLVEAMALGGVEYLFFTSGSDIIFYQEAVAKAHALGRPAPKLITVLHENVTLNAAMGYTMVTGRPSATAVHADLGTLNYGAAIHTAARGGYPVLMTAGAGPRAYSGTMRGDRDHVVYWLQEVRDQGELVRQYTKWDYRLEAQDNPGLVVSRALQVALSEPPGPVYLSIPREIGMLPVQGAHFPTPQQLGLPERLAPDPEAITRLARWLVEANNPVIIDGRSGRHPEAVGALVRLAELLSIPVRGTGWRDRLNFPTNHPLFGADPPLYQADVVLVVESAVPWVPGPEAPGRQAKIAFLDVDPITQAIPTMEFTADLRLQADSARTLIDLYEAATKLLSSSGRCRCVDRLERLQVVKLERERQAECLAMEAARERPINPRWLAYQVGQLVGEEAILLDDALSNSHLVQTYWRSSRPGSLFRTGSSAGGWGPGAAFGAKLAAPDRDVVLAVGDGYYIFGVPLAALWSAVHYKAPYLTVVFQNSSYSTGTWEVHNFYPDGYAARDAFEGGIFDPPPDFAKEAESVGAYGENVYEPEEVAPALRRGLEKVQQGTPAVIAVWLPKLGRRIT